jgi:hypothetical protein
LAEYIPKRKNGFPDSLMVVMGDQLIILNGF